MPGETLEDALAAAAVLREERIGTVLTQLGENVTDVADADRVTRHYHDVLARIASSGIDGEISVKLTQLGLDVDPARCHGNVRGLAARARQLGNFVWIDMEQHRYVDATLGVYRAVVADFPNVGVCLQAYLFRTAGDLSSLIPLGGGVRLVKGAYREPANIAYPKKRDVDENFLALAKRMIGDDARASGLRAVFGTHDASLIKAIQSDGAEFHLLYGIQRAEQRRLAREGHRTRVLISYGEQWFPWYMRRLAERPANVLFVAKAMLSK
jgi:proline dehydrogenase